MKQVRLASRHCRLTISPARTDVASLTRDAVRLAAAALDGLFEQPAPFRCTVAILIILTLGVQSACSSAPRSFAPREPIPLSEFSSQYFDEVLHAHVKDGLVNYPAIAQDDRLQLFIWQLDRFNPTRFHPDNIAWPSGSMPTMRSP